MADTQPYRPEAIRLSEAADYLASRAVHMERDLNKREGGENPPRLEEANRLRDRIDTLRQKAAILREAEGICYSIGTASERVALGVRLPEHWERIVDREDVEAGDGHITGRQIRQARERLGFRQIDLAEALGVPANSVARWERGVVKPQHPQVLALALRQLEREVTGAAH